jgi:DNA-binding MarR family transcriptional regulator
MCKFIIGFNKPYITSIITFVLKVKCKVLGGAIVKDDISRLLEASETLNTQTLSLTRCVILALLAYFVDGVQFRELKASLKISDGKLISNLNLLKRLGYIEKAEVEIDRKKVDVYSLNLKGRKELDKITEWMKLVEKVAKEGDEKCQVILTR